jgi:beta-glucosidase
MTTQLAFPPGFVWGSATAAYQIEGAALEDGRRPSIWDTFCRVPGAVHNGDTGDVACDHYHRLEDDLDLMATLRLPAYRFSVSWPRVLPDPVGKVNQVGLDFYQRLVDGLLERGITPLVTLYHWDLPQPLQDEGGWLSRVTVDRFVEYAEVVGRALGDRVSAITTLNEPFCAAFLGYGSGVHAPGIADNASALAAAHHLNLGHGRAVTALRGVTPSVVDLSVTLNLAQVEPASDSDADRAAAQHVDAIANRIFLEPILQGRYPDRLVEDTQHITDWSFVHAGDLVEIAAPIDLLGVNYYHSTTVADGPVRAGDTDDQPSVNGSPNQTTASPWPGTDRAHSVPRQGPYTEMGWSIDPEGLTRLLVALHRDYPGIPLVITENGRASADVVAADGHIHDNDRIDYLKQHLVAARAAIDAGVDLRGYYLWSLMDNFEWAWGFSKRFGIVYVDYETLERIPKDSALWYRDVITNNAVDSPD